MIVVRLFLKNNYGEHFLGVNGKPSVVPWGVKVVIVRGGCCTSSEHGRRPQNIVDSSSAGAPMDTSSSLSSVIRSVEEVITRFDTRYVNG